MREAWKILILVGVVLASATAVRSSEDARLLALDVLSPQGAAIQQLEAKVEALSAAERGSFVRWVRVEGARLAIQPGGPKPGLYVDDDAFLMERARRAAALAVAGGALAKPKDKRQEATFEQIVAANFQLWSKKEDRASLRLNPDQTFVLDLGWGFTPRILDHPADV